MFEALLTYDIETAGIAAKKSPSADVREVASSFIQGDKGLVKQTTDLAKKLNMTPTPPKEAPLGRTTRTLWRSSTPRREGIRPCLYRQ